MSMFLPVPEPAPPVELPRGIVLSAFSRRSTHFGPCAFREAIIPMYSDSQMRRLWAENKLAFLQRGFSIRKHDESRWMIQQWLVANGNGYTLTPIGQDKLENFTRPAEDALALIEQEAPDLELPPLAPELEAKLYDYQVKPARQLFRALTRGHEEYGYPGGWDCSELGTGKTFQSLAAALHTGHRVGVICPLSVIPAWHRAFHHFHAIPKFVINYESLRTGRRQWVTKETYQRANGEKGRRFAWQCSPASTVLLFDECHFCKNSGTLNQALLLAAVRQRFPVLCISGTLASDPTHMRGTGRVVGLHSGGDAWHRFQTEHGCANYGGRRGAQMKFCGGKRGRIILAKIHRRVFPTRGARVRIEALGDRFPETQILTETFETGATKEIAAAFDLAKSEVDKLRAQHVAEERLAFMSMAAYMKAWHESERLKVDALVGMIEDELDNGRSVALFVNFTDVREAIMRKLKTTCAIYGGQNPKAREACIEAFQADKERVIVAQIDAGGIGVSLHDVRGKFPRTAIIMPTCKVVSLTQALGRVHRAGGKSKSRQIVFYAADTVEEEICEKVRAKMGNIAALNDGDMMPKAKF